MARWFAGKFSRKLAISFSLCAFFSVLVAGTLIARSFRTALETELSQGLTTQAVLIENQIDKRTFLHSNRPALQSLSQQLAKTTHARVTFVASDGRVLGDSSLQPGELEQVENHRNRPEIQQAIKLGEGHAHRMSKTVHSDFMYTAIPVKNNSEIIGFVRLAMPLTQIEKMRRDLYAEIVVLSLIALVVAILLALLISSSLSRPVAEMSEVAGHLAEGRYDRRVTPRAKDEHGRLGETMNLLAERVQTVVHELSHDKSHLTTVLSNMTEAVVAVDPTGRITVVNAALSRLFGIGPEEAKGKIFLEILRQNQLNLMLQAVLKDNKSMTEEVRTFSPDEHIFEAQAVPLIEGDRAAGALLVLHDITRLRRLEQVRRDFVANVSHELRTPLASIKGFAETLRTGALEDSQHRLEFVKSIEKHADDMTALVQDLLDLTAIESGQRTPVKEPQNIRELLQEVVEGLKQMATRKKIKIELDAGADSPAVQADKGHLKQIFTNLLENALKFTPEGGRVELAAKTEGSNAVVVVGDNGMGIPDQDLPRIFERFYRVDKARSRERGGTGLGLSIVKHLVEANGGSVTAESTIGKGSRFIVSLPLAI